MISFIAPGAPFGKQRPRVTKFGTYTPKETVEYENLIRASYKGEPFPFETPLRATIRAFFFIPKSTRQKDREKMIQGIIRPTKKPDNDNIGKIICDALNGVAYHDDKQIVELNIAKYYSEQPRVEVRLEEI